MEEEVLNMWQNFSLVEEEEEGVSLDQPISEKMKAKSTSCLIGKLLSHKNFNVEALRNTMDLVWKPAQGMEVKGVGENLLLFQFNSMGDKIRVLNGCPWSFDKHLLLLEDYNGDVQPSVMLLKTAPFWIQIYDLPLNRMDDKTGELIGNKIGSCIEVDTNADGIGWGRFLRVRVAIDVSKPIKRGMKFKREDGTFSWISFRYERLPNFCYLCGRLDHGERECKHVREGAGANQYGAWLRAGAERRRPEEPRRERKEPEESGGGGFSRADNSESWQKDKEQNKRGREVDKAVGLLLNGTIHGSGQGAEAQSPRVDGVALLGDKGNVTTYKANVPSGHPVEERENEKGKTIASKDVSKGNLMEMEVGGKGSELERYEGCVLGEEILVDVEVMSPPLEDGKTSAGGKKWRRIVRENSELSQVKVQLTDGGKRKFVANNSESFSDVTQQKKRLIIDDLEAAVLSNLAVTENRHRLEQ